MSETKLTFKQKLASYKLYGMPWYYFAIFALVIWSFPMNAGVCHQVLAGKGLVAPEKLIVITDSHTTTDGFGLHSEDGRIVVPRSEGH